MPTPSSAKTTFINEFAGQNNDFSAIRLTLASPDDIHTWSHGEVTKPETINYRTQKPEKDGLFCERIFGPSKDWECYCGKYKRIRYKGIVCDKCGVEVTRAIVRRERFGHIDLATPVSHIWFLRGVPSKVGLLLNLSVQDLEKVIYFASFIITHVNEEARNDTLEQIKNELKTKKKAIERDAELGAQTLNQERAQRLAAAHSDKDKEKISADLSEREQMLKMAEAEKLEQLEKAAETAKKELKDLKVLEIISESAYRDLSLKYGHVFEAQIGAEAIRKLLAAIDLHKLNKVLEEELRVAIPSKKKKLIRRSKLAKNLLLNKIRPEWMILTTVPIIPPDLRPMVALDGGRFATSDLNDLYRRIINRNNRLKRLIELKAPEVIQRNEKRMLQEAVDALFDNSARRSKTVTASTGQRRQLKSIADMLKGKQGRFRQNLLGKRVDYSGRSVIVIGPTLQLHQCGLPKTMALELFRPFVISQLIKQEIVHNVRSANRYIEQDHSEVWDILEEITKNYHVLLNRAPTLHRLGIQAFQPILIEGKAIKIHPMVCSAFNADFDGDQMAVHVPLTEGAKKEAAEIMLSTQNLLKPSSGDPIVEANQDIVWGCYYITDQDPTPATKHFASITEALYAHQIGKIKMQTAILIKIGEAIVSTTAGRIIFNKILPEDFGFINQTLAKKDLRKLIATVFQRYGRERTVEFLDALKTLGFQTITVSGMSFGIDDIPTLAEKSEIVGRGDDMVTEIQKQYEDGLLTKHERYIRVIENWTTIKNEISEMSQNKFTRDSSLFSIVNSGARGTWQQMIQVMGMKGLVNNPSGEIIELPIKASFREGLDVLEYFIASHGTRKGLADTALRTASAGYLTRRLVDIAQDIIITEEDCGDTDGVIMTKDEMSAAAETVTSLITGRTLIAPILDPNTKKVLVPADKILTEEDVKKIGKTEINQIHMRSLLSCKTIRGVCQKCYGLDLAYSQVVKFGTSVGIMAAQSIGEPGTQLTMRTFHTGGVAGADITQGLPRVEELFEVRPPKNQAITSDVTGQVTVDQAIGTGVRNQRLIKIRYQGRIEEEHVVNEDYDVMVSDGEKINVGTILLVHSENEKKKVLAENAGLAKVHDDKIQIITDGEAEKEFIIPPGYALYVKNNDLVKAGDPLTEGALDLQELFATQGVTACQKYIIKEVQRIYATQAGKLNSKHLELIVRQLFSRYYIKDSGDTGLLPGEIITRGQFLEENELVLKDNKTPAEGRMILLGITKASLTTDSFLSAASFQETARVLIDAAVSGKIDRLRGLKENVIIGRLIPAGTGWGVERPKAVVEE